MDAILGTDLVIVNVVIQGIGKIALFMVFLVHNIIVF